MPKFESREHAHKIHENYNVDTDQEGKYNLHDIYSLGRKRIQYLLDAVPEFSHVLEVGCNSGGLLRVLTSENKCYCEGIDISHEMVHRAVSKGLNCKVGVAEELPYDDYRFDVVIITEVMEHLYDANDALREIRRVLKPGGLIIGSVPHPDSQNSTKKTIDEHDWHGKIYKEMELSELLNDYFINVETTNISWYNDQEDKPQWIGFKAVK